MEEGRHRQDDIRKTIYIVAAIQRRGEGAILVSMDAKKAYDSVSWTFLYKVLGKFGFNENPYRYIKSLYHGPTARVKVNGSLKNRIKLERSTRQGCCPPPPPPPPPTQPKQKKK